MKHENLLEESNEKHTKGRAKETFKVYSIVSTVIGFIVAWQLRPGFLGMKPSFSDYARYLGRYIEDCLNGRNSPNNSIVTEINTVLIIGAVVGLVMGIAFATLINSIRAKK